MIIVQTPLRISLFGGGTDFEDFYKVKGGAVLSTAINKYIFVIVKERFDNSVCVNYSKREVVDNYDMIEHDLVRETIRLTGGIRSVEITTLADIPSHGSGLGSSSSVTVGLLQALYNYQGEIKTAETLAQEACQIEIDILDKPIGKQDQYIAAFGNMQIISFNCDAIKLEKISISSDIKRRFFENFLLFYTGIRKSSDEILTEQKNSINDCIDVLVEMKGMVFKAKEAILIGEYDEIGRMLDYGWKLKKLLSSRISNPVMDDMYNTGIKAGALGGKIAGSGGGGFILLYCPIGKKDNVRYALHGLKELPFTYEPDGSKVIFNYRRL